jgi:hypothetical protein
VNRAALGVLVNCAAFGMLVDPDGMIRGLDFSSNGLPDPSGSRIDRSVLSAGAAL